MNNRCILCVDEDESVLFALCEQLTKKFGHKFEVKTAISGKKALEIIQACIDKKKEIPLLICDAIIPHMNGNEFLEKCQHLLPKAKRILLTEAKIEKVIEVIKHTPLFRYVSKPWKEHEFMLTVKEALRSHHQQNLIVTEKEKLKNLNYQLNKKVVERTLELQLKNIQLKENNTQLHELKHFKDDLTKMLIHDLKSPLSVILNLNKDPLVEVSARMMLNMISSLLDIQRLKTSKLSLNLCEFSLNLVIEDIYKYLKHLKRDSVVFKNNISESFMLNADKDLITRVMINLISNAFKFVDRRGTIEITAFKNNNLSRVEVTDVGRGIPKEKHKEIFGKYNQVEIKNLGLSASTGIGLTFCKLAIEEHKGKIGIDSLYTDGAKFFFEIPSPVLDSIPISNSNNNSIYYKKSG